MNLKSKNIPSKIPSKKLFPSTFLFSALFFSLFNISPLTGACCSVPTTVMDPPALPLKQSCILEINHLEEILNHVTEHSLVLFDIDNTLMTTPQTLGSDQWFSWRISMYEKAGLNGPDALDSALMDWVAVQCLTKMKAVEPTTHQTVKRVQAIALATMGLTARGGTLATHTGHQLKLMDIHFTPSAPVKEEVVFLNPHEVIYKNGIMCTAGQNKGTCLFKFLDLVKSQFSMDPIQQVILIDDKRRHLEAMQKACEERCIPFIGFRYGRLDDEVKNFSEEVGKYQFEQFGKILSDEEAMEALKISRMNCAQS